MNDNIYNLSIEKNLDIPIYVQLGKAILNLIESGRLKSDEKLPAIRTMAKAYNVNNDTIVRTYKYLIEKKCVYSHIGKGTFVSPLPHGLGTKPVISKNVVQEPGFTFDMASSINFAATSTKEELFPVDDFKKIFNEVLDRDRGLAFSYEEGLGYLPLRESICEYLFGYGIKTNSSKVQIISGAQQGIDIVSKVMLAYSDTLFVEKPTFYGAIGAFLSRGGQIIEIPLMDDGIDLDMFESYIKLYSPKFFYMMSYYQTPSGVTYSIEKKRRLIEICDKYDTYIVEEDNVSDFHYTNDLIVPLKALDYKNRVIYIKTFSKILMPGLRIGFLVYPKKLISKIESDKSIIDASASGFIQRAFHLYMESNLWSEHKRNMIEYYKKKYELTVNLCEKYLKGLCEFKKPGGGLSLWIKVNKEIYINDLCNALVKLNVIVSPGGLYYAKNEDSRHIRISFANVSDESIEKGILIIKGVLESYKPYLK